MAIFELACPACRGGLTVDRETAYCEACQRRYRRQNDIWRFLLPERAARFENLAEEYRLLREAEGWGAADASYYRALPEVAADDPQRAIWRIVAKNFQRLVRYLNELEPARILDIGSGNGWLANQLTRRGYTVAALDLSDDVRDGLGAAVNYETSFERYQAEFDRLPFRQGQFDAVLFSASLHYSNALADTLGEAARVLGPNGQVIVLATPVYTMPNSGATMIAERERTFRVRFGFEQTARTTGFSTERQLAQAAEEAGLSVNFWHGDDHWIKQLRRVWIQKKTGREPARFPLIVMRRI